MRDGYRLVVAVQGTAVAGFSWGYIGERGQYWADLVARELPGVASEWVGGHFEYVTLGVAPRYRRGGLGRQLHDTLLDGVGERALLSTTDNPRRPGRTAVPQQRQAQTRRPETRQASDGPGGPALSGIRYLSLLIRSPVCFTRLARRTPIPPVTHSQAGKAPCHAHFDNDIEYQPRETAHPEDADQQFKPEGDSWRKQNICRTSEHRANYKSQGPTVGHGHSCPAHPAVYGSYQLRAAAGPGGVAAFGCWVEAC